MSKWDWNMMGWFYLIVAVLLLIFDPEREVAFWACMILSAIYLRTTPREQ